jgi:type I restriction enzyme R subunit
MIKKAADENAPLMTAEQRIDAALTKVVADKSFDADQEAWLKRIRNHLVQNLSVDEEDFNVVPLFARNGGWGRAKKVFGSELEPMLKQLNTAVAA